MAKRDPDKSARNRIINNIKEELRDILPEVLKKTGVSSEQSLNAKIGSKNDEFFDLKNEVINSHEEFINKWLQGLKAQITTWDSPAHQWIYDQAKKHDVFKKYLLSLVSQRFIE